MLNNQKLLSILLVLTVLASPVSWAADDGPMTRDKVVSARLRRQVRTIFLGGLAGGILGMSLLSFYGRPQDKLTMIPMGAGLGLIIGTVYSTAEMVRYPREHIGMNDLTIPPVAVAPSLSWTVSF